MTLPVARDDPQVLRRPAGRLLMVVKSAHVYETEFGYVRGVLAEAGDGRSG